MHPENTTNTTRQTLAAVMAVACLAFAGGVAQGATYYWDINGVASGLGGAGVWNSTNPFFSESVDGDEAGVVWSNGEHTVIFNGSAAPVQLDGVFELNQLTFSSTGYALNGGALQFVNSGTTVPSIRINSGVEATFTTTITAAALKLAGGGTLVLGKSDVFADTTAINLTGSTTMDLAGVTESVGGFTLTSGNIVDRSGSGTSTLSALSFTATAGSVDIGLVGDGTLTKTGAGTVVLNGSNAYSGLTTVAGGILVINGKNSGIGDTLVSAGSLQLGSSGAVASRKISVSDGGMLTGFGYAHSVIDLDGGISPGLLSERVGTLNTGAQTWGSTGTYYWDITNVNGAAGTDWDLLNLNGNALVIQSGFTLRVIGLLDPATGFDSTKSYGWLIAANLTSVTGVDEAIRIMLNDAQDSRFTLRGDFQTNGLYLDFTPVPEPAHYAMILAAATVGLVGYRRWRRTERLA